MYMQVVWVIIDTYVYQEEIDSFCINTKRLV